MVLNGQLSSWSNIETGVPQGSIPGTLLFLIYIKDLLDGLSTNARLFADDVSLFSVVDNMNLSATLTEFQSQAHEDIFSRKTKKTSQLPLNFSNNSVQQVQFQKHFGFYLDIKLDFREHLQTTLRKINKIITLLRKLQNSLPSATLVTIYKLFVIPHLYYGDIFYDQTFNNSFHERLESIQ